MDDALQQALVEAAVIRDYAKNQTVFGHGDACDGLYAIVEGSVRVTTSVNGKESLLALFGAPLWVGELSVIDGAPRTHEVTADQSSRLLHISMEALDQIFSKHPIFYRALGRLINQKLRLALQLMLDSATASINVRTARQLLLLASAYGEWTDRAALNLHIRQEQLALMLSTSRQTINQILRTMVEQNAIRIAYGRIELVDLNVLRQLAAMPPANPAAAGAYGAR